MDPLEKLKQAIIAQVKAHIPVQTVYAECVSVNADQGTMVARRNDLDYEHVLLGLGAQITVPEPGSRVLLGLIENNASATWLIYAERIAELRLNGNANGGIVVADSVAEKLNAIVQDLNTIKAVFSAWVPVLGDGGTVLKGAAQAWAAQPLVATVSVQLQNPKVSHG